MNELKQIFQIKEIQKILTQGFLNLKDNDKITKVSLERDTWVNVLIPIIIKPTHSKISPVDYIEEVLFKGLNVNQIWQNYRVGLD